MPWNNPTLETIIFCRGGATESRTREVESKGRAAGAGDEGT